MFLPGQKVTRTYRIQTQPGPMTIGYAVEACWEPPTFNPVTNPAADFPISANQSEPYVERYYLNDGQPITDPTIGKKYPIYVQWREWPSVLPNNASCPYLDYSYVAGKWTHDGPTLGGECDNWRSGPEPGTDDVYQIWCNNVCQPGWYCISFGPYGKLQWLLCLAEVLMVRA